MLQRIQLLFKHPRVNNKAMKLISIIFRNKPWILKFKSIFKIGECFKIINNFECIKIKLWKGQSLFFFLIFLSLSNLISAINLSLPFIIFSKNKLEITLFLYRFRRWFELGACIKIGGFLHFCEDLSRARYPLISK